MPFKAHEPRNYAHDPSHQRNPKEQKRKDQQVSNRDLAESQGNHQLCFVCFHFLLPFFFVLLLPFFFVFLLPYLFLYVFFVSCVWVFFLSFFLLLPFTAIQPRLFNTPSLPDLQLAGLA